MENPIINNKTMGNLDEIRKGGNIKDGVLMRMTSCDHCEMLYNGHDQAPNLP